MKAAFLALVILPTALPAWGAPLDMANDDLFTGRRNAVVRAAERAGPAVVTVSVLRRQLVQYRDPAQEFFNPFFRGVRRRYWQHVKGLGSGVLVRPDGVILTNYHVVKGAEDIRITLATGASIRRATLAAKSCMTWPFCR